MKKITRLLLLAAISIGMVACSNDDVPQTPESLRGTTYASIAVALPGGPSTRALPEDNNPLGKWGGTDKIETITVFLVNETLKTIDYSTFKASTFTGITGSGVLVPNLAVKATPGENVKAYIVLNGLSSTILGTLKTATPATFDDTYKAVIKEVASALASNDGTNDDVMMTNTVDPVAIEIAPEVTEAQAKDGTGNRIEVQVERVVSRAIVTAKAAAKTATIQLQDAMKNNASKITIKDVKYVVGQSNKEFYMIKQTDYVTPATVYNHVPSESVTWVPANFDNEGLASPTEVIAATGADALDKFEGALEGEGVNSKFVLPVTHNGAANYKKGNTTYFEVTAIFTPDAVTVDAASAKPTYAHGEDVFLGMNDGLFYNTRDLAEADGQKATHYKGDTSTGAIMKYVLWLNPDEIPVAGGPKAKMSPTVRNQVYHAHINSFLKIGIPNNPLNPTDPNNPDPDNPTDPTIPGNFNPENPIKPTDPLETEDTYLSVQITVLPWGMHSYQIDLGNDY